MDVDQCGAHDACFRADGIVHSAVSVTKKVLSSSQQCGHRLSMHHGIGPSSDITVSVSLSWSGLSVIGAQGGVKGAHPLGARG